MTNLTKLAQIVMCTAGLIACPHTWAQSTPGAAPPRGSLLDMDGAKLYYEECGQGDPILFVHEFGGHHLSWEPQLRYFARRYRCVTYAARGWPPSDVPATVAAYSQARGAYDRAMGACLEGRGYTIK